MSLLPCRRDVNKMRSPSGENAGSNSSDRVLVKHLSCVPSKRTTHIPELEPGTFSSPPWNAISRPCGDHAGSELPANPNRGVKPTDVVTARSSVPSGGMTKTFIRSLPARPVNVIHRPFGLHVESNAIL